MIANIHGSYLTEREDPKTVLAAKGGTFTELRKREDMPWGVGRG
jgi:hypothetical protein